MLHIFAHLVIFTCGLVAAFEVSRSFNALIKMRWRTRIAAKLFFIGVALTHLAIAVEREDSLFFILTDVVQAVSLVTFLILLYLDLMAALRNLRLAFKAIQLEYDGDGDRMIATVTTALRRGR